jgi:membrane protein YdbS with pleckstrin-like domain
MKITITLKRSEPEVMKVIKKTFIISFVGWIIIVYNTGLYLYDDTLWIKTDLSNTFLLSFLGFLVSLLITSWKIRNYNF